MKQGTQMTRMPLLQPPTSYDGLEPSKCCVKVGQAAVRFANNNTSLAMERRYLMYNHRS